MNDIEKADIIAYKMEPANKALVEVELLINNDMLHSAVNRLYYACFYAVSALLINSGIEARKHSGVKQMFGLHFVIPGIISKDTGKFYTEVFGKRQKGDYEDLVSFEKEEVEMLLVPARQLINEIEEVLSKK